MTKPLHTTENLFSYGTLQFESVQISTFGRLLEGHKDKMIGYKMDMIKIEDEEVVKTSGKEYHPIVRYTGKATDFAEGTMFKITKEELENADRYEVDSYERISVDLESGQKAWVYIEASTENNKKTA